MGAGFSRRTPTHRGSSSPRSRTGHTHRPCWPRGWSCPRSTGTTCRPSRSSASTLCPRVGSGSCPPSAAPPMWSALPTPLRSSSRSTSRDGSTLTPAVAKAASGLGLIQSSDQQEATIKLASLFSSMLRSSYEQGQASAESRLRQEAAHSSAGGGDGNATRHEGGLPPNVSNLAHGGGPAGARLHTAHSNLDGVSSLLDRSARAPRTPGQRPGGKTGALTVRHDEMPAARRHARAPLFGEPSSRL
mmetsp:Transcript_38457/g.120029  ORF Transcript_38457/g.120029 Transcript_38457/m.120029 type:complete len:245 (+) Transcript_38457:1542-2276(+)